MLGSDKSRSYCLEMICAGFLAGANLQEGNPDAPVLTVRRLVEMLPTGQREQYLQGADAVPPRAGRNRHAPNNVAGKICGLTVEADKVELPTLAVKSI